VGQLAGGVAHNFNNLLTAIAGYGELLLARLPADSDLRADAEQIKRATERAAEVTRGLLLFSRRERGQRESLDLNEVVSDMEALLKHLIRSDIEFVTNLAPDLGIVKGDRSQFEQALVNLVVNAHDAMPRGGLLAIETNNFELAKPLLEGDLSFAAGSYVRLVVSDTGSGMDEETKARIFEPFFTTKGPDRGTGLGLSTVFGIVEEAGGRILVESQPDEGTTFTILVPRFDEGRDSSSAG
jgi:signal transduction histidine kinase